MARTKRQRKLETRRRRDFQRELEQRAAAATAETYLAASTESGHSLPA